MKWLALPVLWFAVPLSLAESQPRLLKTETTQTAPEGYLVVEMGIEMFQDAVFNFSGLRGDLTRAGVYGFRLGIGPAAEFQVQGTLQDSLSIEERSPAPNSALDIAGDATSDFGDVTLAAKMRLKQEGTRVPALGFRFAVELPNASSEKGLGNDETNAFAAVLLTKRVGKTTLAGNLGLAILGDPVDAGAQDDLLTYGAALIHPITRSLSLLTDFYGRAGPAGIGTEEQTRLRLGVQVEVSGFLLDAASFIGFRSTDPSWGLILGLSRPLKLR